jgi:preprotein translocase subunit SecD
MFTAITCSRTLLMTAIGFPQLRKPELYAPKLQAFGKSQAGVGQ